MAAGYKMDERRKDSRQRDQLDSNYNYLSIR